MAIAIGQILYNNLIPQFNYFNNGQQLEGP